MYRDNRLTTPSTDSPLTGDTHRFPSLRFYGEEFVFNTASGMFYRVSPTAGFLLHALDHGADPTELPGLLEQRYGISPTVSLRDVELLLNDLIAMGIIEQLSE